jgi:hypothetical protein
MPITDAALNKTVTGISNDEILALETYYRDLLKKTTSTTEKEHFEGILQEIPKKRFDIVMRDIKSRGDSIQNILQTTGLRERLLNGELEHYPWWAKAIAGLEYTFEKNDYWLKQAQPDPMRAQIRNISADKNILFKTVGDKITYIGHLIDQLERNNNRILNPEVKILCNTLITYLEQFIKESKSNIFKSLGKKQIDRLNAIIQTKNVS